MCIRARKLSTRCPIAAHWFVAGACVAVLASDARAQITNSYWTGVSGNWSNPALWSTNPFYPQDGNPPGSTYNAILQNETNTLTVDRPITVSRLNWGSGTIAGPGPLTAINGATISSGTLSAPLIVGAGMTTQIATAAPFVITSAGSLSGPGDVKFTGSGAGVVTINGAFNVAGGAFLGTVPGVNFNVPTTLSVLGVGEALGGTGDINVNTLNWIGGEIRGSGKIVAQVAATIRPQQIDYSLPQLTGRTLSLAGATNSLSTFGGTTFLPLGGGGVLSVESGATLDISGNVNFTHSGGGGTISNAGTIRTTPVVSPVTGMSIASGLTLDNRGVLLLGQNAGPLTVSGTLKGTGVISGPVTINSGGVIAPGASAGTLHLSGPLTMNSGSALQVELGGPIPDIQHDQLDVSTGTVTLNGPALNTLLGYAPSPADNLVILRAASLTGGFSGLTNGTEFLIGRFNGVDYAGRITYTPTSVVLGNIHAVPEPAAWLLAGGAAVAWVMRRKALAGVARSGRKKGVPLL